MSDLLSAWSETLQQAFCKSKKTVLQKTLPLTFWRNANGANRYYWGGVDPEVGLGEDICGCNMDNSCDDPAERCNCDVNDYHWRRDEGNITVKKDLPISMFLAGDTGKYDAEISVERGQDLFCLQHLTWKRTKPAALQSDIFCGISNNERVSNVLWIAFPWQAKGWWAEHFGIASWDFFCKRDSVPKIFWMTLFFF